MTIDLVRLREEIEEILRFLPRYALNPVQGIRAFPPWSWPSTLCLLVGAALISGAVSGLLSFQIWSFVLGILILPVSSVALAILLSALLFLFFKLVYSARLEKQRLFGVVTLAILPHLAFHAFSSLVPVLDLIGFLATCGLLIVGLNEHFRIRRRLLFALIGSVYAVFSIIWGISQYRAVTQTERLRDLALPKPLDTLESEVRED